MTLLVGLRQVRENFQREMELAFEESGEYYRFLKALGFYAFIDQVITACALFPRSMAACDDNLNDLSFGLYNDLGIGRHYLSHRDQENLSKLVLMAGKEVISQLNAHGYYFSESQIPRYERNNPNYATDLQAIADVRRISEIAYQVNVNEYHFDDEEPPTNQNDVFGHRVLTRSLQ